MSACSGSQLAGTALDGLESVKKTHQVAERWRKAIRGGCGRPGRRCLPKPGKPVPAGTRPAPFFNSNPATSRRSGHGQNFGIEDFGIEDLILRTWH
jgi:hypothetical protein